MGGAACTDPTEDASDIFEMCRLEYGVYRRGGGGGAAAWCSVLTPAMIRVLEYDEDLHYYWAAGYGGDDVSYTPACTLVADVLRHLVYDTHTHTHTHTRTQRYSNSHQFQEASNNHYLTVLRSHHDLSFVTVSL